MIKTSAIFRFVAAALIALAPVHALAQSATSGAVGNAASSFATQIAGRDAAGKLAVPKIDTAGIVTHGPGGTLTNCSSTITTGGTSQQIAASAASRLFLLVQNPASETETLFIDIGAAASTTAGTSIELAPGAMRVFSGADFIPTGNVFATAVTTGHKYICKVG